jgi:PmbA protein
MFSRDDALNRTTDLVAHAMRGGADAADAVYGGHAGRDVSVRLGKLEEVGSSEGAEIGLRVFIGSRSATASSGDLSAEALYVLVERTIAMARAAPEDAYAGLAPEALLTSGPFADFDSDDGVDVDPEALKTRALIAEDAARAVPGVTNSQGGSASVNWAVSAIATSTGFAGSTQGRSHSVSASVLAEAGDAMERDYAYHSVRHLSDLDDPAVIGREAGTRAVARLNSVRLKSGPMPVIFDPRVGPSLLGHLMGAITGSAIARKTSFLLDALGTTIFDSDVTIIDDPWLPRGFRSRAFDAEGLPTRPRNLIDGGVLTQWIAESASARQIGIDPTGHATRGISGAPGAGASNLRMLAGAVPPADLMADIIDGFYVTELIGMGVNGLTGDYSRGASGFRIRDGLRAEAVSEVTIAGNLRDIFAQIVPANDLTLRYAVNTPTLRVDRLTIAGD